MNDKFRMPKVFGYLFSGGVNEAANVLPASCRQIIQSRIGSFCR